MPIPAIASTIIPAAGQVVGGRMNAITGLANTFVQDRLNQRNYRQQRADAISFWNMQNEYNTPQAQMQRYKDAGLNPHLIYGQGNSGNSGAINAPSLTPTTTTDPRPGDYLASGATSFINQIYDLEYKRAQIDNLKAQNKVIQNEAVLKSASTDRLKFDLGLDTELRGVSADYRREKLRQLSNEIDFKKNEDARRALLTTKNLEQAAEMMLNLKEQRLNMAQQRKHSQQDIFRMQLEMRRTREQIELMKKDGTLRELDIRLREDGINPNDPMWARILGQFLSNLTEGETESGTGGIFNLLFK